MGVKFRKEKGEYKESILIPAQSTFDIVPIGESPAICGWLSFFCAVNPRHAFIATREAMYEPLCRRHLPAWVGVQSRSQRVLTPVASICVFITLLQSNCSTLINMQRICMPPLSQGGKKVQEKTPLLEAEVSFQESLLRAHELKRCKTGVKQLFKTV